MHGSPVFRLLMIACALVMAACGTVATPPWEARQAATEAALNAAAEDSEATDEGESVAAAAAAADENAIVAAPTSAPTSTPVPPTATAVPPTATPVPPTATATLAPTSTPEATTEAEAAIASAESVGDPAAGQALFVNGRPAQGAVACTTCHLVDQSAMLVGPGLLGLADRAGSTVPGQDAYTYLYNSIVVPNEHVVQGYTPGIMPMTYATAYSEQEINDLVAYLLTLHQ